MPKVSVILPAYNVSNYLDRSLQSLLNQTYKDFEVIIVNDGSTDNIIEKFNDMDLDSRFLLFSKNNEGSGFARNYGLKRAKGKYIYFMDPDDAINKKLLEDNVNFLDKYNSDFTIFGYEELYQNGKLKKIYSIPNESHIKTRTALQKELLSLNQTTSIVAIWNKMYNNSFLNKYKVNFSNLPVGQDAEFNWKVFKYAKSMTSIPKNYYFYFIDRPGSARTRYDKKRYPSEKIVLKQMEETISKWENPSLYTKLISKYKVNIIITEILNIRKGKNKTSQKLIEDSLFREVQSLKYISVKGIKMKLKLAIIKYNLF